MSDDAATDAALDTPDALTACLRTPVAAPLSAKIAGTLAATNGDDHGSCGGVGIGESIYFIDVPPGAQLLATADEGTTSADTTLYFRTTCEDPSTEVYCDSDGGRGDFAAYHMLAPTATRYYVFIDGENAGDFASRISALLPQGAACDTTSGREICGAGLACLSNQCQPAPCPLADTLTGANSYSRTADTLTGTNYQAGTCGEGNDGGLRSPEIIYQLILSSAVANVRVSTDSTMTDYDTLIYIRKAACSGVEVACDDDGAGSAASASQFDTGSLLAGDYYIVIDGFGGRYGIAQVTVTITP